MDGGIGVFTNWRENSWEALEFQGETGLLLTCDGNVGIPVLMKQGNHHLERRRGDNGALLELRLEPQGSSPGLTWLSGFLWGFNRGVRPRLVWRHGSPLSSQGVKQVSGFLSS